MSFLHAVIVAVAATGAAGLTCPLAVNTGAVGSCMVSACSASRGPTNCELGTCYCKEGFCRYPASTVHVQSRYCVQRVPSLTCHVSRVCYSAGLSQSFCEKGLCMCKWGYFANEDGKCVPGGLEALSGVPGNLTVAEAEELAENRRKEDMAVSLNVLMFCLYVALAAMAVFGGAALLLRKAQARPAEVEVADYKLLAA